MRRCVAGSVVLLTCRDAVMVNTAHSLTQSLLGALCLVSYHTAGAWSIIRTSFVAGLKRCEYVAHGSRNLFLSS